MISAQHSEKVQEAGAQTRELANFVSKLKYEDLPGEVVEKAKECLLDQLGVQLMGSTLPWTMPVYRLVADFPGPSQSTVVNYGLRTSVYDCAMINATFGQSCELDDLLVKGGGHGGAATVPVSLASAERDGSSGKDIITAIVAGYEVMSRISEATPARSKRGFHTQSTVGVFAAAAAAGKMLKLDADRMQHAFGIAGSHCSGTSEFDQSGGEVKRFHAGLAARNGIQSALLAQYGLTGPLTILEGKKGFCRTFSDLSFDVTKITASLGDSFAIMDTWFKFHPVVYGIQTPIDVLSKLIAQESIDVDMVSEIRVGMSENAASHAASISEPADVVGAQFSLAFSLALRLIKKTNDFPLYMDPVLWRDERFLNLGRKIKAYPLEGAIGKNRYACEVTVTLFDGRELHGHQQFPTGHPRNPVSRDVFVGKFKRLADSVLQPQQADQLIGMVDALPSLSNMKPLVDLLVKKNALPEAGIMKLSENE